MTSFANDPYELNMVIRLWPDGPPTSLPCVGPEITFGSPAVFGPETVMLRNVSDPSLTVFAPDPAKANGAGPRRRLAGSGLGAMRGSTRRAGWRRAGTPQCGVD